MKNGNKQFVSKNVNFFKSFCFALAIFFSYYSIFLNKSYTSDHLGIHVMFPKSIANYVVGGRLIAFAFDVFYYILNHFNISKWENAWVLQLCSIITLAISVSIISNQYKNIPIAKDKNIYAITMIICLAFTNPFFVETFVYIGFELSIAILFIVFSLALYTKRKYIFAWILLLLAVCTYQSYYVVFFLSVATYLYMRNSLHIDRSIFLQEICAFLFTISACITNIVITKVYSNIIQISEIKKVVLPFSNSNIIDDLFDSIKGTFFYLNGFYYPGILVIVFVIAFSVGCVCIYKKDRLLDILFWIIVNFILLLLPYAIGTIMDGMFFPPRIIWPIFLSVSLQILMVYCMVSQRTERVFLFVGGIFVLYNLFQTQTSILELYQSNTLDIEYVRMVQKNIEDYENESGIRVTKVATFRNDNSESYYKDYTFHKYRGYSYTRKMVSVDWGDVDLLNEMNWEVYEKIPFVNKALQDKMSDYDSQVFDADEQLFFDNDTLYWFIY